MGRKFEKRAAKKSREAEKDYIRDLSSRKKDHAAAKPGAGIAGFAALTTSVLESTNAWMFPKPASKQPDKVRFYANSVQSATPTEIAHSLTLEESNRGQQGTKAQRL